MKAATIDLERQDVLIDNPLTTYAQTLHEAQQGSMSAGKIKATINLRTLMGGFARFGQHGKLPPAHLCEAAKKFKSTWEAAQLGGAKAMDPAKEAVDGGRGSFGSLDSGIDARQEMIRVRELLGPVDMRRLEYVLIREAGPTGYGQWRASLGGPAVKGESLKRYKREVWAIVDRLAVHWRFRAA